MGVAGHYARIHYMTCIQEMSAGLTVGTVGRVYLHAIQIEYTFTVDRIIIWQMGTSAGNVRAAIYHDAGDTPATGTLIVESGSIALGGAWNATEITIAATRLTPGLYWLAVMFDDATPVLYSPLSVFQTGGNNTLRGKRITVDPGYGAYPDPCPAVTDWISTPFMGVRVSSTP